MSDLIRRKDAIDAIHKSTEKYNYFMGMENYTDEDAIEAINTVPASQVISDAEWIPVTERLPEEREWLGTKRFGTTISDEVYVTFENPKGERFCKHLSFQNGKLSGFDQSTIDAFYPEAKPIAWMPLPEPWRGE